MSSFSNPTVEQLSTIYPEFMVLHLYVDPAYPALRELYANQVEKHNKHILENPDQYNAGFDMFVTEVTFAGTGSMRLIDFQVVAGAKMYRTHVTQNAHNLISSVNTGYYIYPRSSISKTELRLANNVGIIDSGYRGHLMGFFDYVHLQDRYDTELPLVSYGNRITQICAPGLQPIYVVLVNSLEELGVTTRGAGGFGSTGR